jgi:hypothetical protein
LATTLTRPTSGHPGGGSLPSAAQSFDPPRATRTRRKTLGRRLTSEGGLVFLLCLAIYLVVAVLLDFRYDTFNGDATSRLANGFYVLYSVDPHLASVGFVWNPGTSIADMIPLLFYHLWTPLASHMFAGSLVSAVGMAGAVYQVRTLLLEWGVARPPRLVLTAVLALNAMILYYGGNGMSEGLYVFSVVATCRYLLRWIRVGDLRSLAYSATSLGLCYLVRNEAVGPAFLGGLVVIAVGYSRRSNSPMARLKGALNDAVIFEIPFIVVFAGWAIASFVITGQPFQQFTSIYGTTSQIKVSGQTGGHTGVGARILHDVHAVGYLAPSIPLLIVVALFLAFRRRDFSILAPLSIVGGGLTFDLLAYIDNSIAAWFRYFILSVPLEVLLVGSFFASAPAVLGAARGVPIARGRGRGWIIGGVSALLALVILVPSEITTVMGMANPNIGLEETQHLAFIFARHPTRYEEQARVTYPDEVKISNYFATLHLAKAQVIVDNFSGCVPQIITISPDPDIFTIPNDRKFQRTLADPLTFHAHYILDVDPVGDGTLTAPNIEYPGLWSSGDGFAKLTHVFPAVGECPKFKLFKVTAHPH